MKRTRQPSPAGLEIKMVMLQKNITIKELASRICKSEATVCEVISGKNKSQKTRELIMKELDYFTDSAWDIE